MPDLDTQLRTYLDVTAPPVAFEEIVAERFRRNSVRPSAVDRSRVPVGGRRWMSASAAAFGMVVVLVVAMLFYLADGRQPTDQPPADVTTSLAPAIVDEDAQIVLRADDLAFRIVIPAPGWELKPGVALTKSTVGPQSAEAIIYWSRFPDGRSMTWCSEAIWGGELSGLLPTDVPHEQSFARLTSAIAHLPGTEVVEAPTVSVVGGYPTYQVSVRITDDVGCDPGYFYGWQPWRGGAIWDTADEGDTIRVWFIDRGEGGGSSGSAGQDVLFIASVTTPDAGTAVKSEISQVIGSLQFDSDVAATNDPNGVEAPAFDSRQLNEGEYSFLADGLPFVARMPRGRWETYGGFLLSTSTQGSQGAEAVVYWTNAQLGLSGAGPVTACHFSAFPSSSGRFTDPVPGLTSLSPMEETTVGGRPARHFTFSVQDDLGCDPGYFFGWRPQPLGMMWYRTDVGATIDVWFVDVEGGGLFIAGIASSDAPPSVVSEVRAIVGSIRFEP